MSSLVRGQQKAGRGLPLLVFCCLLLSLLQFGCQKAGSDWTYRDRPSNEGASVDAHIEFLEERLKKGFDWSSLSVWHEMARFSADSGFDYDTDWQRSDLPLLVMAGDRDHLMPPEEARIAYERSGSTDKTFVELDDWSHGHHWGHLDLVLGRHAPAHSWPLLHEWMCRRA